MRDELRGWDDLPAVVLLLTPDGRASRSNKAFAELTGLTPADSAGVGWSGAIAPESRVPLLAALAREGDLNIPLRVLRADGRPCYVDCRSRWLADEGLHLCVFHDVSRARLTELSAVAQARQLRVVADNVPVMVASYDAKTDRVIFANGAYAAAFGLTETSIIGRSYAEVVGVEAAREIEPYVDRVRQLRQSSRYVRERPSPHGSRWIEVHLVPHTDEAGQLVACFVMVHDITRHQLAERAVRESEERLAKFMQASVEGIVFHQDGRITDVNPSLLELLGYEMPEIVGRDVLHFVAPEAASQVAAVRASGRETSYETVLLHRDGRRIPVEVIVRSMQRSGQLVRMNVVRDIRDREAARSRIHHLAHHDPLTGLPNRMAFMEQLEHAMVASAASGTPLALLFIDLDHFKRVNDSLGHLAGDALLQRLSERLVATLRITDRVARFGGDEFMVLLPGAAQQHEVEEVAAKLLAAIEVPITLEGRALSVSPSIGVALYPQHGQSAAELIKNADTAMYLAKSRGRANVQFFEPHMAEGAYAALVLEGELAVAVAQGEFELEYQPEVDARDGRLVGAEALIRWRHPRRGLLAPDAFIPVAEERRLMLPIGGWVLREAARQARRWHELGHPVPVAVNLSTLQFRAPGFVDAVARILEEEGVPGWLIELELTERMLMDDLTEVKRRLMELKALGVSIAVDDFGTGYSSLGHLKDLPIDKLKIDQSFVRDLPHDLGAVAITRAIVMMGQSLHLTVVAEGVENEAQRAFLVEQGCTALQGFLIGAAVAGTDWPQPLAPTPAVPA